MNITQTVRMLRYRWKLAFLVLIVVFTASFGVLYIKTVIPLEAQANIAETVQKETVSYRTTTIFACGKLNNNEIDTFLDEDWINASVCNAVLNQIIAEIDISSLDNVPEDSTAGAIFNESAVILTVSGPDITAVGLLTDNITKTFSNQKLPTKIVYRGSPIKLIFTPTPVQAPARNKVIQIAYNGLISLIAAMLFTLFAVLTREKCDKTIRSIYHLRNACDVSILPCISEKPIESEFFSLADSLEPYNTVVLAGIKNKVKPLDLACHLANTAARKDFPVAIINLTNDKKEIKSSATHIIDTWKASPAAFFRSESFRTEIEQLRSKYKLILFAVPSISETAHAISLAKLAQVILLIRFGKDTDQDLHKAQKVFEGNKEALFGASIVSYLQDEEYIFGGSFENPNAE